MSYEPLTAADLDVLERLCVPDWLRRGIPLAACADYIALVRAMSEFNAGMTEWEQAGRPVPVDDDLFETTNAARERMIVAALSLSTRDHVPADWERKYRSVIEDERLMRGRRPLRIVED